MVIELPLTDTETLDDQAAAFTAAAVLVPAGGADSAPEDWTATTSTVATTTIRVAAMAAIRGAVELERRTSVLSRVGPTPVPKKLADRLNLFPARVAGCRRQRVRSR